MPYVLLTDQYLEVLLYQNQNQFSFSMNLNNEKRITQTCQDSFWMIFGKIDHYVTVLLLLWYYYSSEASMCVRRNVFYHVLLVGKRPPEGADSKRQNIAG